MLGNTEKHTIHNNIPAIQTSFSSIINEPVDDFQSAHMIQKIKKIKKKKQKQNISGMADFDVLTNTNNHGSPLAAADAHVPASTNTSSASIFNMQYWKQLVFGKTVEGVVNFKEDDYEGRDNLNEPTRKTNIKRKIKDMIESAYAKVNNVNQQIAAGICNVLSSNTATKNDIAIVRNQIVLLETALISMPVVYNWYYLMFYAKYIGVKIPELSRNELFKTFGDFKPIQMLLYLFNIAIWFPEKLDGFLLQQIPEMTSRFFNGTCKFILLYILCFIMIKYSAVTVKDFFIDLVTDATGNWVINLMFAIVFILFLISVFTLNFIGDIGHDVQEVMSVGETMLNPIWSFIRMIIRFLITMVISVPLGAIMCALYLVLYSFFGAYIYGGVSKGISKFKTEVDEHIRNDNAGVFKEDTCNNGGLWALILSIIDAIFTFMKYIKEHLLKIVIAAIFIYSSINITSNFSNEIKNGILLHQVKPFDAISHLVSKSVSPDNSEYFFYEDFNGFNLRTLKSMKNDSSGKEKTFIYYQDKTRRFGNKENEQVSDYFRILYLTQHKQQDYFELVQDGAVINQVSVFDIINKEVITKDFRYNTSANSAFVLGNKTAFPSNTVSFIAFTNSPPYNEKKYPYDIAPHSKIAISEKAWNRDDYLLDNYNIPVAQRTLMEQNKITVEIYGNPNVFPGDIINMKVPSKSGIDSDLESLIRRQSGKFLVGAVKHNIFGTKFQTFLDLYVDSYDQEVTERSPEKSNETT